MRMRLTRNRGFLVLGIWLVLSGALPLLGITFGGSALFMQILAIVAGVLILVGS